MALRDRIAALATTGEIPIILSWLDSNPAATVAQLYAQHPRADLMLWLLCRCAGRPGWPSANNVLRIALLAAEEAELIIQVERPSEQRPAQALQAVEAYSLGQIGLGLVEVAALKAQVAAEQGERIGLYRLSEAAYACHHAGMALVQWKRGYYNGSSGARAHCWCSMWCSGRALADGYPGAELDILGTLALMMRAEASAGPEEEIPSQ